MADIEIITSEQKPTEGMVTLTHVMYGLHAFSVLMGALGPVLIVTAFLTGWPSIIAIIVNYARRPDVRGTYLDSHFSWQLRTFWFALLWIMFAGLLFISILGIPLAWTLAVIVGLWVIYRLTRGWVALINNEPMPMPIQ
ncbi:MAG TPA: hypothetical protein VLV32_10800 [Burkholderiales bacterium]|nr:hypothetical protein [Burkholderiales bacterium]